MDAPRTAEEGKEMAQVIGIRTLEVKRQIRRREYAVDVEAVAEAIVRRLTARRPAAEDPGATPATSEEPAGLVS
jgi:hypothetical protein